MIQMIAPINSKYWAILWIMMSNNKITKVQSNLMKNLPNLCNKKKL